MRKCKVVSVKKLGKMPTYNATMLSDQHNYAIENNGQVVVTMNSHSAAYSYLAYQTAWLKCHYRKYFMCALLTSVMSSQKEKERVKYEIDCKRFDIPVLDFHINHSKDKYCPEKGGIRRPLTAIKGVGKKAAQAIVVGQPFSSVDDFFYKVGKSVNRGAFEAIVNAGATEVWGEKRNVLIEQFEALRTKATKRRKSEEAKIGFESGDLYND